MLVHPPWLVRTAVLIVDLIVERAVGALGDPVLLDHIGVERLALAVFGAVASVLLVVGVLGLGVGAANVDVEGAGEEFGAHAVFWVVDGALGTLGWLATAWWRGGEGVVSFLVTIGAGDDDLKVQAVITEVVGGSGLDTRAPERTLEVGDG